MASAERDEKIFSSCEEAWHKWLDSPHFADLGISDLILAQQVFQAGFHFAASMDDMWPRRDSDNG